MNKKEGNKSWNAHIKQLHNERIAKEVNDLLAHRKEVRINHQMHAGRINKRLDSDVAGFFYVIHNGKQVLKTKDAKKAVVKYDKL